MSYQLSRKEILNEIMKSGKDPNFFINDYCKISHPLKGLIPFKTFDYQTDLLDSFVDHRFTIILKARQLGISMITAAYVVWLMLFHRNKEVLVMATKFSTAANLVKKVKFIMAQLPDWMKIATITVDNRTSFELSNGSQIKASSTAGDAGRSEALSLLVVDEAAHIEGFDDLWTSLYPTLSTGGSCIALSTPKGVGNWFHKMYIQADMEENDFFPVRLPWDVHPWRDLKWFEKETKNMSRREIAQELECNFNTSGDTVIAAEDIERIEQTVVEPLYRTGFDRNLWIWEEHIPGDTYLIVADTARGDGADSSTFEVFNITEGMRQDAEYQGKVTSDVFANILNETGREYGDCLVVVEINAGQAVAQKMIDVEYPNLYWAAKGTHEYVEAYIAENMSNTLPGFTTSRTTRPLVVGKLEEFVRNELITLRSQRLLKEFATFIWNNGRPEAMRGYNDDLIMACAIAAYVADDALEVGKRDLKYKKAFLDMGGIVRIGTTLSTTIPGQRGYDPRLDSSKGNEPTNPYPWLIKG